jgi:plasmid stabilization system protein ParE
MKALVWTLEALQDREAIYDYIETDNPGAAIALDERFAKKAARFWWIVPLSGGRAVSPAHAS